MSSATSPPAATSSRSESAPPNIAVTFQDVRDGRAYIRIPPVGKLLLAHWAGAPWWDKSADAFLHGAQTEALLRREREKIVHGGSRLGKSVLGGGCETIWALMIPGWRIGVTSDIYEHVGDEWQYLDKGMRRLFPNGHAFTRIAFRNSQNYHDFECHTIWDSKARGFSAESDEGGSLLGKPFNLVIVGEGSRVSKFVYDARILRATNGALMRPQDGSPIRETGYTFIYTTPNEFSGCSAAEWERVLHQTKRRPEALHYGATDFASSVWIREADVLENPNYDRTAYEAARRSMDSRAFAEQMQGKMRFATGRVLHHYEPDRHLTEPATDEEIRAMRLGIGLDTGAYTGWVLAGIEPSGRMRAIAELYTEKLDFEKSLNAWRVVLVERLRGALSLDPNDVPGSLERLRATGAIDVWAVDPASQHKLDFHALMPGFSLTPASGLNGGKLELLPSLDEYNAWFRFDDVMLDREWTPTLQQQLERYRWKTASVSRAGLAKEPPVKEPLKEFDHLIDASRFVFVELKKRGPRVRKLDAFADAWAQRSAQRFMSNPLKSILDRAKRAGGIQT